MATEVEELEIELQDVVPAGVKDGAALLEFRTSRGALQGVFHEASDPDRGMVWVSGAGGGFNGPANSYGDLSRTLVREHCSSLRLDYRYPGDLEECVLDLLLGVEFLAAADLTRIGACGWSFGGAVAIMAAGLSQHISGVATVASQTYGTELVDRISPRPVLFLHGQDDRTLSPDCSLDLYQRAGEPKEVKLYPRANHGLDQVRDEMIEELLRFARSLP